MDLCDICGDEFEGCGEFCSLCGNIVCGVCYNDAAECCSECTNDHYELEEFEYEEEAPF